MLGQHIYGTFALPSQTQTAGTAIVAFIPPFRSGAGNPPLAYKLDKNQVPIWRQGYTHITQLTYTASTTAHTVVVMRPLNYAMITTAVAANSATVVLDADPGSYSTAYRYDLPTAAAGKPSCAANNLIAASDYVAFQLRDGTWHVSAVTSVSGLTLTLTTSTPNVTGGGSDANIPLFFFGASTDTNPQTNAAHVSFLSVASARTDLISNVGFGDVPALNSGDPLLVYSANATAAGTLSSCVGYYGSY
jgi:hypothetical protein